MPSAPRHAPQSPPAPPDGRRARWVELSAALTAVVVSFGSLLVAQHQAAVMDRQLAAQVWPLVEYGTSNLTDDGKPQISLDLSNSGVGPTRVRSVRLTYRGRDVRNAGELLRSCCRAAIDTARPFQNDVVTSDITGHVVTAGKTVHFLALVPDTGQRALYRTFDRERFQVAARVCYCSVLDECWVMASDRGNADPAPVRSCAEEQKATQYR